MVDRIKQNPFIIRVYGLFINKQNQVLISDEYFLDTKMIKFPGGGLEFGEGTQDCLKREAIEEFGQEIEIIDHFYTTDYYQKALFYENAQLFSIYYFARFKEDINFTISNKSFDFEELKNGSQSFRWVNVDKTLIEMLTFPIDKKVTVLLHQALEKNEIPDHVKF
jgi:ADP-ribose pyrophosphatase YjhB (NUDIX family)